MPVVEHPEDGGNDRPEGHGGLRRVAHQVVARQLQHLVQGEDEQEHRGRRGQGAHAEHAAQVEAAHKRDRRHQLHEPVGAFAAMVEPAAHDGHAGHADDAAHHDGAVLEEPQQGGHGVGPLPVGEGRQQHERRHGAAGHGLLILEADGSNPGHVAEGEAHGAKERRRGREADVDVLERDRQRDVDQGQDGAVLEPPFPLNLPLVEREGQGRRKQQRADQRQVDVHGALAGPSPHNCPEADGVERHLIGDERDVLEQLGNLNDRRAKKCCNSCHKANNGHKQQHVKNTLNRALAHADLRHSRRKLAGHNIVHSHLATAVLAELIEIKVLLCGSSLGGNNTLLGRLPDTLD